MIFLKKLNNFMKNNSQNIFFLLIFFLSFLLSLTIFILLSGYLSNPVEIEKISFLLSINFLMVILLIILSVDRIIRIFILKKSKIKSNLRIQFTSLFIFITLIPTTIVTIFSLIFFDQGIKLWFNDKVSQVVKGSKHISESYFTEHTRNIKNDILFIKNEISNDKIIFFTDEERLTNLLEYLAALKDLDEAVIFEKTGQLLARIGSFFIKSESRPPLWKADNDKIAIFPNEDKTKVRALIRLQRAIPTYLYIGKNVDPNVLGRVESVNKAAIEYNSIEEKIDSFQFQFNKLFVAINLLMILMAMWFGLKFSNKIIEPIMEIIYASEKIIKGDLSTRIRSFQGYQDFNTLSKVLNKMLDKLNDQKNKLVLRKKFTEKIIDDVSTSIVYVDLNDKVLLFNKKTQEIFGNSIKNDFLKKNHEINTLFKKFKQNPLEKKEAQIKFLTNENLKILNIKIVSEVEKKKIKGFIFNIDDITELVSAQKNAAWSNVARYMAHEIKNPLTPIKLSAQRLESFFQKKNKINKDSFINCTDTIVRQVNDIENLVTEFSNFARMPTSKFKQSLLNNIILQQINSQKIVYKNIQFIYNCNSKNISLNCDYDQLSRVFLNLLKNSAESIKKKDKVVMIEIIDNKKFVVVNIEDSGEGFPDNRDKLFEPYVTNKKNGSGLGLSICKKIIEDHNGEINLLNSQALGGALVKIKLFKS